jgi:hypothetical protein
MDSDNEYAYSEEGEVRDNFDSDPEYDDYASEPELEPQELENNYTELLKERYYNLMDYENKVVDTKTYNIKNADITRQLHELQFKARKTERNIINKEIELRLMLERIESRIKENQELFEQDEKLPDFKNKTRFVLTPVELKQIKDIKQELDRLIDSHEFIEESNEPIVSNLWLEEWNMLADKDRQQLERIAGRPFPKPEEYSSPELLEKAQNDFLDDIKMGLSYFEPFISDEEKELRGLATRHGIKPPPKGTKAHEEFLIEMRKLLRKGYIYRAGIRKIGGTYDKVYTKSSPKEFVNLLQEMRSQLPYTLEPDEQEFADELKREARFLEKLRPFLAKLNKEELYTCITNSQLTNRSTFKPKQFPVEAPKKVFIPRVNSRQRILNLFKPNSEIIVKKVSELEQYIYKITADNADWYNKKIKDVLFILNTYPDFKQKFANGEINIFQLALFENLLLQNGVLKVYPVKYETRQKTLNKLVQSLYKDAVKIPVFRLSEILTKTVLTRRSKVLEKFVFELAKTKQDYLSKIEILIKFIESNGKLARTMDPSDLLKLFDAGTPPQSSDYTSYSQEELAALLSDVQIKIDELTLKIKQLDAVNFSSVYVIFWPIPPQVKPDDPLKLLFEQKLKALTPPSSVYFMNKNHNSLITDLNKLRIQILNKYNLRYKRESGKLVSQLKEETDKRIKILKIYNTKILENYKKSGAALERTAELTTGNKYFVDSDKITEMVAAVKRKLIKQNFPNVEIELLELYDMNELFNRSTSRHTVGDRQENIRFIDPVVYKKIKDYLIAEIDKSGFSISAQNNKYLEQAIKLIVAKTGIEIGDITVYQKAIDELAQKWKPTWEGEDLKDNYGENVFERLLRVSSGLGFYTRNISQYYMLEQKFTPKEMVINRRPKARFENTWYNVEYLDKDWVTDEPLFKIETVPELTSTGRMELVERKIILPGKIPYIKRVLPTNKQGKTMEIWQEVEPGQIRYLEFGTKKNKGKGKYGEKNRHVKKQRVLESRRK